MSLIKITQKTKDERRKSKKCDISTWQSSFHNRINDIELRTIRFADALLMPITSFKEAYTELSHNINNLELLIRALSDTFNAPQESVQRRLKQVINTKL